MRSEFLIFRSSTMRSSTSHSFRTAGMEYNIIVPNKSIKSSLGGRRKPVETRAYTPVHSNNKPLQMAQQSVVVRIVYTE